jgi:hypothetical protein
LYRIGRDGIGDAGVSGMEFWQEGQGRLDPVFISAQLRGFRSIKAVLLKA